MKNIKVFAVLCVLVSLLCGCVPDINDIYKPELAEVPTEKTERQTEEKAEDNSDSRTVDISEGIDSDGTSFTYSYDFDFDGEDENIELRAVSSDDWAGELNITVGEYTKTVEMYDGTIEAVYGCDINTDDGVKDIAIITCEMSGDPRIRILTYNENLTDYEFVEEEDGQEVIYEENWLGYACSYYFNVNDDDTLTIEEQTDCIGMWSVYKTYYMNNEGMFVEDKPEKYEILPDFMQNSYYTNEMSSAERSKWENGYIKAHADYKGSDLPISDGEYFKVLYDDGVDCVYIEKENGEEGWIYIGYDVEGRYELNPYYFYLAG